MGLHRLHKDFAMTLTSSLADVHRQIMWTRLISVVEEQARTLVRASFSTAVREAGDLSAGVFDLRGRMLAQAATGTPGHVNTMAMSVQRFLTKFPIDQMKLGGAYVTNDPWLASGHLHDITVVSPAFHGGTLVAIFASVIHLVDVGGRGMGPDARQVFEEGIAIPMMPLMRQGRMNEDLMQILLANTREPAQVEGDVHAVLAAGAEGSRRLSEMLEEFKVDDVEELGGYIIEESRRATLDAIRTLRFGVYSNSMTVDGYGAPITLQATCTITPDQIAVDWSGTSPMSRYGINVVEAYTAAYTCFGLRCALAPEIPNNHGSLALFKVSAPPGCILHAIRPAPVAARHIIGLMLPDVVFGCLEQVLPGGVQAEGGLMWNPYVRGSRGPDGAHRAWESFFFANGGTGARPNKDGMSATAFPAGTRSVPIEAAEMVAPVVIVKKELRPDSGGAGRYRGGLGQTIHITSCTPGPFSVQAMFDRIDHPALGRKGGQPGAAGECRLLSGAPINGMGLQEIPVGGVLVLELPGGAGHGDPSERDSEAIAQDIANGYVTADAAARQYGYKNEPTPHSPGLSFHEAVQAEPQ
jgi:N-methylhydantoinase B